MGRIWVVIALGHPCECRFAPFASPYAARRGRCVMSRTVVIGVGASVMGGLVVWGRTAPRRPGPLPQPSPAER